MCSVKLVYVLQVYSGLIDIQDIQGNDILEILGSLGDEQRSFGHEVGGSWTCFGFFLHLMLKRSRKEVKLNSLYHRISSLSCKE